MRYLLFILSGLFFFIQASAQKNSFVADSIGYAAIKQCEQTFPQFYREFEYIKAQDTLIKKFVFVQQPGTGPAFASPKGVITINISYLNKPKPNFDDNRLIVVLYHEVGHLHYFLTIDRTKWNPEDSEKAAFEYSLLKTKEMAEKNDCLPLATGLKFMKLRSMSNDLQDAHVRALKRMVNEPLYTGYVKYVSSKCNMTIK
ncbi:hypothetical protein ACFQ3S_08605 [Mucilaginibacter terrae]|uniref:hypothetical protein n=1 Tax=Mucilaginibacter terrae TaxID=1955052 RepID=UPI00363D764D